MLFHLAKRPPGRRALIGEIVIIVIGVLIALGAEQLIEGWSWDRKVAASEQMMNEEIKSSLMAVVEINRLAKCSMTLLESLQDAVVRGDQAKARQIIDNGTAFGITRLWADNAFEATLAAQVSDHLGAEKLRNYSQTYQMIRDLRRLQNSFDAVPSELAVVYFLPTMPSSAQRRDAQLREVANYRIRALSLVNLGESLSSYAKARLGLETTEREYLAAPSRVEILKTCEAGAVELKP